MEAYLRRLNMKPEKSSDNSPNRSTIERFFSGLSEYIFQSKLGVVDVQLIDYISDMLLRFVRMDTVHRVRRNNGRPATELVQMMVEAEKRIGLAKRDVHRHIGDELFWSGMYPCCAACRKIPGRFSGFLQTGQKSLCDGRRDQGRRKQALQRSAASTQQRIRNVRVRITRSTARVGAGIL